MALTAEEQGELDELIEAIVDETISPGQHAHLQNVLADKSEARVHFVLTMGLHASLCTYAGEVGRSPSRSAWFRRLDRRTVVASLSAAVALVIAAVFLVWGGGDPRVRARLADVQSPVWGADQPPLTVGSRLGRGDRIDLVSGSLELAYANGATVRLNGPVSYHVGGSDESSSTPATGEEEGASPVTHGFVDRGSVVVTCPPGAEGFALAGPHVRVVDLGTRFSLDVDEAGRTEMHVLEGRVRLFQLAANGTVTARRTLLEHEVGRIEDERLRIGRSADGHTVAAEDPGAGALYVDVGRPAIRAWREIVRDDHAYSRRQEVNPVGETRIWLPYGDRPGLFGKVRGVLTDPEAGKPAYFESGDRNADALLAFDLRFDEPIAAFRFSDVRAVWDLGPNTQGGLEYSVDGDLWTPIRVVAGPHTAVMQPFVVDFEIAGLDTRELHLRYFTRPVENPTGPVGPRSMHVRLSGDPGWPDASTAFFKHQIQLVVQPAMP